MKKIVYLSMFYLSMYANTNWDYSMNMNDGWAHANLVFLGCNGGNQQSPINISTKNVKPGAPDFSIQYIVAKGVNLTLKNNTFTITYPHGSFLEISGRRYHIKEIYFKTPAENGIDSKYYPMEMQILHEDSKKNKLILSVLFNDGSANDTLDILAKNLPKQEGKSYFITNFDINKLIPKKLDSYQFYGSLTMPPCTQDVQWIILKQYMYITKTQLNNMLNITKQNARTTQELYNRLILD